MLTFWLQFNWMYQFKFYTRFRNTFSSFCMPTYDFVAIERWNSVRNVCSSVVRMRMSTVATVLWDDTILWTFRTPTPMILGLVSRWIRKTHWTKLIVIFLRHFGCLFILPNHFHFLVTLIWPFFYWFSPRSELLFQQLINAKFELVKEKHSYFIHSFISFILSRIFVHILLLSW